MYRVETGNLYSEMANLKHLSDLSDYPAEPFLHDKTNKKIPLTMTDELQGKILKDVVCLRSKFYSIQFQGGDKQSAKRVQKSVKKPQITNCSANVCWTKEKLKVHDPT